MASWIADVESKIYTMVKYKGEQALKSKYPNIYYTTDSQKEAFFSKPLSSSSNSLPIPCAANS